MKFITFFGSARLAENAPECAAARQLARAIALRGCGIITGGGGGIMAAANAGAHEAKAPSVGINIRLPHEQKSNPFCSEIKLHTDISTRKKELIARADGFVVCAGGFGTLDELFEVLTLAQTQLDRKKIVLFGVDFWRPLVEGFFPSLVERGLIDAGSVLIDEGGASPVSASPVVNKSGMDIACEEKFLAFCSDDVAKIIEYLGV